MTAFDANDPLHQAAKDYHDAVTKPEESSNGIRTCEQIQRVTKAMADMKNSCDPTKDKIHQVAGAFLDSRQTKSVIERQNAENRLIEVTVEAMLEAGISTPV